MSKKPYTPRRRQLERAKQDLGINLNDSLRDYVRDNCRHPEAQNPPNSQLICITCAIRWSEQRQNKGE